MQSKVNLQERTKNALSELGEKIFLDRYAVKDVKRETLTVGDTVVVLVNPKTGQREIGIIETLDVSRREVSVRLRDGQIELRAIEHVDKPLETVPEQMFERIARHIASVESTLEKQTEWQDKFRNHLLFERAQFAFQHQGTFLQQDGQRGDFLLGDPGHMLGLGQVCLVLELQQRQQVAPTVGRVGLAHQLCFAHAGARVGFAVGVQGAGQLPVNRA